MTLQVSTLKGIDDPVRHPTDNLQVIVVDPSPGEVLLTVSSQLLQIFI